MSRQSSATAPLRRAEQPWRSDVRVSDEYTSFATKQTTGGEVWGAARSLQAYLETHPAELGSCRTLLELGSGTGWLGMMVATNPNPNRNPSPRPSPRPRAGPSPNPNPNPNPNSNPNSNPNPTLTRSRSTCRPSSTST